MHSTLTSSDQLLPKVITMPSMNESANDYTQVTSSSNIIMSTVSSYVKRFKPAITFMPLSKHYGFKTKISQLPAKLFWQNYNLMEYFDKENLTFNRKVQ